MPARPRSLSNSSHGLYARLPPHPAHQTNRVCVLEVAFDLSQTRLRCYYRELHSNIRLGRFLELVQHVRARLIQREDCGERGLATLSFHVIARRIRIMSPVDKLWLSLLIWVPWDAAVIWNERQMRPRPTFNSRRGKLCQWGSCLRVPYLDK